VEIVITLRLTEHEITQLIDWLEFIGRWASAAQIRSDQERRCARDTQNRE
jgi:hypothetical protein